MPQLVIGPYAIALLDRSATAEGETTGGVAAGGRSLLYELIGPDGLHLTVRDTQWDNGERDLAACDRHASPKQFDTLVERLRLSVLDRSGPYIDLRQARVRANGRAGLFDATATELDTGAGLDVVGVLKTNGAIEIDTRERLLGDLGSTRNRLGARLSPASLGPVPVVAYVVTRVAPVATGFSA